MVLLINNFKAMIHKCTLYFQLSLPDPPVSPITTILPLTFVVVVSMIKQVRCTLQFYVKVSKILDKWFI